MAYERTEEIAPNYEEVREKVRKSSDLDQMSLLFYLMGYHSHYPDLIDVIAGWFEDKEYFAAQRLEQERYKEKYGDELPERDYYEGESPDF